MIQAQYLIFAATMMLASTAAASDIRRVVTGLDESNKAKVLFDSRMPITSNTGPFGINSTNLWITNSYPLGFSTNRHRGNSRIGISPPKNGTKFRVVEFGPLNPGDRSRRWTRLISS